MPIRRHHAHEQEEDEKIGDGEAVGDREKLPARHARDDGGEERVGDQHADEREGVHPGQIFDAAARTDFFANRTENVIPGEDDEVENEGEPHSPELVRLHVDRALTQS